MFRKKFQLKKNRVSPYLNLDNFPKRKKFRYRNITQAVSHIAAYPIMKYKMYQYQVITTINNILILIRRAVFSAWGCHYLIHKYIQQLCHRTRIEKTRSIFKIVTTPTQPQLNSKVKFDMKMSLHHHHHHPPPPQPPPAPPAPPHKLKTTTIYHLSLTQF